MKERRKGEGLEAWRQLKLEYEGKSGNRQTALLRGIHNPRAAWEADDGRSVVESLNRWEKTIGLCRTASGVGISDGILAATVLEHSLESYQNILNQAPSNVRASYSAMRCGDTTGPLDLLRTKPNLLDQCQRRSIRLAQCQVSRLARTGKGSRKEWARARMARAKARARKVTRAGMDQKPVSKHEQFQGYCGYCEKWGHERADCRKRIADGKSKGGASAASAHNDGDVTAVMEVDDAVMGTGDDETSTGWCFAVASLCAAAGSTGALLLDSGSDEHLCTPKVADLIPARPDRTPLKFKDVQQNGLATSGHKTVPMLE